MSLTGRAGSPTEAIELTPTLRQAIQLERARAPRAPGAEPSSRERILDAAEALFAEEGPDVVSLRDISARSGAATGLIHYHFPAKETLIEEVVARRASVISEIRRDQLTKLGDTPTVPALLDAFVRPLMELATGPDAGWASYCRVISLISSSEARAPLIAKHLDGTAKLYVAKLREMAPQADQRDVLYAFGFTVILMVNVIVKSHRVLTMSESQLPPLETETLYRRMMNYCVAGVQTLIAPP